MTWHAEGLLHLNQTCGRAITYITELPTGLGFRFQGCICRARAALPVAEPPMRYEPRANSLRGRIVDFPSQVPCSLLENPELATGSDTLPTDPTDHRVTMQHSPGTALIWHDRQLLYCNEHLHHYNIPIYSIIHSI